MSETPKCWCRKCRPVTMEDMRFVACPSCGDKRCVHAEDHEAPCAKDDIFAHNRFVEHENESLKAALRLATADVGAVDKLERALTAERERADRAKAEGIKEGMRRAAEIAEQQNDEHAKNLSMGKGTWPQSDYIRDEIWHQWEGQERASRWIANAILKEAGE